MNLFGIDLTTLAILTVALFVVTRPAIRARLASLFVGQPQPAPTAIYRPPATEAPQPIGIITTMDAAGKARADVLILEKIAEAEAKDRIIKIARALDDEAAAIPAPAPRTSTARTSAAKATAKARPAK